MTINIPAEASTQSFEIGTINSGTAECTETFNVTITSVTGCGVTIGNNNISEVKIQDNKSQSIKFYDCSYID